MGGDWDPDSYRRGTQAYKEKQYSDNLKRMNSGSFAPRPTKTKAVRDPVLLSETRTYRKSKVDFPLSPEQIKENRQKILAVFFLLGVIWFGYAILHLESIFSYVALLLGSLSLLWIALKVRKTLMVVGAIAAVLYVVTHWK